MAWPFVFASIIGSLIALMATGMPIALAFMLVNILGIYFVMGTAGLENLSSTFVSSLASFTLLPVPMFILMGELLFRARLAEDILNTVDLWLGKLPGRLSLLANLTGALFGTFTGSSLASTAMLGSTLVRQMQKQGYSKSMSLGPILGSGGLAMLIPPSGLAILVGAIGQISIGGILVAIIVPGVLLALMFSVYIVVRARLQPHLAPAYDTPPAPYAHRVRMTIKYVLPLGFLLFLVVGLMMLGIATPEESAAAGVLGAAALVFAYGRGSPQVFMTAIRETTLLTGMIFLIIAGATAFSQLLAFTGATQGMANFVINLPAPPIIIIGAMVVTVLFLGTFMGPISVMLITLPAFLPAVTSLGYDPIWFAVLFLLAIEMGFTTPPYGPSLFVLKACVPGTTFKDVSVAAAPYLVIDVVLVAAILAWPTLVLWLPAQMR